MNECLILRLGSWYLRIMSLFFVFHFYPNPNLLYLPCLPYLLFPLSVLHFPFYTSHMSLHLYNSLTKKEEEFVPIKEGEVMMYSCGPTVYGRPHIGNYSTFLLADLLRRPSRIFNVPFSRQPISSSACRNSSPL